MVSITDAGQTAQLEVGKSLPTATDELGGLYVLASPAGNAIGVCPAPLMRVNAFALTKSPAGFD